jgi:hypothetical protein
MIHVLTAFAAAYQQVTEFHKQHPKLDQVLLDAARERLLGE